MIKGKIVGLRAIEEKDLISLKNFRNIPEFRINFREVRELSDYDQKKWIEYLNKSKEINFMFSIIDLKNKNLIGACGLLYTNWSARFADFSFYIGDNLEYCSGERSLEASELLIDYGFNNLNLNKIWMELYEFDNDKINFFTKFYNFKIDGKLRENCFENGKYYDSLIISLLRKDYKKQG